MFVLIGNKDNENCAQRIGGDSIAKRCHRVRKVRQTKALANKRTALELKALLPNLSGMLFTTNKRESWVIFWYIILTQPKHHQKVITIHSSLLSKSFPSKTCTYQLTWFLPQRLPHQLTQFMSPKDSLWKNPLKKYQRILVVFLIS